MWRCLLMAGIFLSGHAYAQKMVSGMVVEENQKGRILPLQGVAVQWLNSNQGTYTDSLGYFEIAELKGASRLVFNYLGYKSDTVAVVNPNKLTVLLKKSGSLETVTIEYRSKSTRLSMIDPIKTQHIGERELFKAACCNLSESFETNPSVDVSYTDAVTGAKQIQLLGLAGPYTLISQENIPSIRGFNTINGLSYLPGTWIKSMQLSKGTGSVVNGYEGIAGQLNVELRQPDDKEQLIYNAYAGMGGRIETNVVANTALRPNLTTAIMYHYSDRLLATDRNDDGFIDNAMGKTNKFLNRWDWKTRWGLNVHGGFIYTQDNKSGGSFANGEIGRYRFDRNLEQWDVFLKAGILFPEFKYRSIGVQLSLIDYRQKMNFSTVNQLDGNQQSLYANVIYQDIIGTTDHKYRLGFNAFRDRYAERFNLLDYGRNEKVLGAFAEYSFLGSDKFSMVLGGRIDYHNLFSWQFTPRINTRFAINSKHVLRASAGLGRKTANPVSENSGLLASSRQWVISGYKQGLPYGLGQEKALSFGVNYTYKFELDYREGFFGIDLYRTDFLDQVLVDVDHSSREVLVYNLTGRSSSNALQVQLDYEVFKHFDLRLAYRFYDVRADITKGLLQRPFVSNHRYFINMAYETRNRWVFDLTLNTSGKKRLPITADNPPAFQISANSPAFTLVNAQITKGFGERWEVYAGVENVFDFVQQRAIVSAEDPFSTYFDASMVWGPVFGRMAYAGLRYTIKRPEVRE